MKTATKRWIVNGLILIAALVAAFTIASCSPYLSPNYTDEQKFVLDSIRASKTRIYDNRYDNFNPWIYGNPLWIDPVWDYRWNFNRGFRGNTIIIGPRKPAVVPRKPIQGPRRNYRPPSNNRYHPKNGGRSFRPIPKGGVGKKK